MSASTWVDCMSVDDAEIFTERSQERRQVFDDAVQLPLMSKLSPLIWAFLQVRDLEKVKTITKNNDWWKDGGDLEPGFVSEARDAVLLWKQRPETRDAAATDYKQASSKRSFSTAFSNPPPSPPRQASVNSPFQRTRFGKQQGGSEHSVRRDYKIAKLCKQRDGDLCVVSRLAAVDACHIYPWCAFGESRKRVNNFWIVLKAFWPEDKVKSWQDKIFKDDRGNSRKGTETVENMLTLTSTLHRFHSDGAFALRPVRMSDDKAQLELEFHWLHRQVRKAGEKVNVLEEPLSSRHRTDSGIGVHCCRFDPMPPTLLVSGTKFTLKTDDVVNKPLPDPGLLEMQWHLQRILAMSGAAGWKEEDFDDDDAATGVMAPHSVKEWIVDQPDEYPQSRCSSPCESVESVDGAYK